MKTTLRARFLSLDILFLAALGAVIVVLYFLDPSENPLFPPCPSNAITGLYCPGCGTLRALHALSHLNLREALSFNALTVLALPFLPFLALFPEKFSSPKISLAILIIILLFCVLRNLPYFSFLAPQ